jgi:GNAT superfamily N-acetyltransferase
MNEQVHSLSNLTIRPVTAELWPDIERLFGPRGACGGCWCMWWKLPRNQFDARKGEGNRQALRVEIEAGGVPGLLAYAGSEPIGWVAVAPRESYPTLERSRVLKRVDAEPVWSVVCFFVARQRRKKGITVELLEAAVRYAGERGATIVEGYPVEPKQGSTADAFVYTGLASSFRRAGFVEVARRSDTRPIMRKAVGRSAADC